MLAGDGDSETRRGALANHCTVRSKIGRGHVIMYTAYEAYVYLLLRQYTHSISLSTSHREVYNPDSLISYSMRIYGRPYVGDYAKIFLLFEFFCFRHSQ